MEKKNKKERSLEYKVLISVWPVTFLSVLSFFVSFLITFSGRLHGIHHIKIFHFSCLTSQQEEKCISGKDLFRQCYMPPHRDRSCRSNYWVAISLSHSIQTLGQLVSVLALYHQRQFLSYFHEPNCRSPVLQRKSPKISVASVPLRWGRERERTGTDTHHLVLNKTPETNTGMKHWKPNIVLQICW